MELVFFENLIGILKFRVLISVGLNFTNFSITGRQINVKNKAPKILNAATRPKS